MLRTLELVSIALAIATAAFVLVLAVRRVVLARRARRTEEAEERLRPLALALLDGEVQGSRLSKRDALVLAAVLARYARRLTGEPRARIAVFCEERGLVDRSLRLLRSRRAWRRGAAAFALGDMASARAVPALIAALEDRDAGVRSAAARSLGALHAVDAVEPLVEALATGVVPRAVAGGALLAIGPDAVERLFELAESDDSQIRAAAIELAGLIGHAADARALVPRLRDGSADVRAAAARALARLGALEATEGVRALLGDRIPFVRAAAARALGEIGDRSSAPRLIEQATSDRFEPAHAAARALAMLEPDGLYTLALRPDAGTHVREAATLALLKRA